MMIITLSLNYNSILQLDTRTKYDLYECLRRCIGMCNESRVTCMKNYAWWLCHKYDFNYMIMHGNMTIWCVSYEQNGGKLHGNISRNGYGNAMIGRYGGCFEEDIWWLFCVRYIVGVWHRRKLRGTREASNGGRVRVRIIHGLNISHKELIYLLQKFMSHQNKAINACS